MAKLKLVLLLLTGGIMGISACKKEDESSLEVVQKNIVGKWPIKYQIATTYTNNIATKADTLIKYNPIDTLVFDGEGKANYRNKTIISTTSYAISADGEYITLGNNPAQKIIFFSYTRMGIGTETTSQVGGKEIKVVKADYYLKNSN